jgi:sugar phosphate isomerase/epimerase
MKSDRRRFLKQLGGFTASFAAISAGLASCNNADEPKTDEASAKDLFFRISLAEWSLHKELFSGQLDNLDFPMVARRDYDIYIVEYVNQFFKDKAEDSAYLNELLARCRDNGITNHLIMVDGEGNLGDKDAAKRMQAVENHYKWVNAAKFLGCTTIRVNAYGEGTAEEVKGYAVEGLSRLAEYAEKEGINVIVENHGGYTSNGAWLADVMRGVNKPNVGTLPDFGNFCLKYGPNGCEEQYDRYKGVEEMMPFAKGASAKSYDFDENGNCIETDYERMLKIVKDSGFKGIIGVEYEGSKLPAREGIKKTKALLERIGRSL